MLNVYFVSMNKKLIVMILVFGLGLALVIGGGLWYWKSKSESKPVEQPQVPPEIQVTPAASPEAATTSGEIKSFTVEGSSFKFVPEVIKVKKGDNVTITFRSVGGTHDFAIDEFDVKTNQIGDGEEEDVDFIADKVGTFEFYCSVGNHRQMGMVGELVVE